VSVPVAVVRPDSWNIALFVHLLGSMVLVGTLALAVVALLAAWRNGSEATVQLGFRALAWVGIPAWVVMYAGALWIEHKEGYDDHGVSWTDIGHNTAEPGLLLLLLATLLSGLGLRRARRGEGAGGVGRAATILIAISLAAYLVAIWAMTTKPT
jgi:hypothetical protein